MTDEAPADPVSSPEPTPPPEPASPPESAPPSESASPPALKGTGFIHLRAPDEMRLITLWWAEVPDGWEATFARWKPGALNLRTRSAYGNTLRSSTFWRRAYFHPEVADRLLDVGNRRSLLLLELADYPDPGTPGAPGAGCGPVLQIGALEVLRVSGAGDGPCTVVLVVHAIVPRPDYGRLHATVVRHGALSQVGEAISTILSDSDVCGPHRVVLGSDRAGRAGWVAPPLLTITWVPRSISSRWDPRPHETAQEMSARLEVPVSAEHLGRLREGASKGTDTALLTSAGWQWTEHPLQGGVELNGEMYEDQERRTHALSQSWAMTVSERSIAYLSRQGDEFLNEARLRACSVDLDVCLLIVLDHLRVRSLSQDLARAATELRDLLRQASRGAPPVDRLNRLIDSAIALDSDAVSFMVSEWWTDVSSHQRADYVLTWMMEASRLDDAVAQVVEQARLLREAMQTLLDREEHRVEVERREIERRREVIERRRQAIERRRQESSRMMETALAALTVVGLPVTIFLQVWFGWDPTRSVGRAYALFFGSTVPWWVVMGGGAGLSLGVGLVSHWWIRRWARHGSENEDDGLPHIGS